MGTSSVTDDVRPKTGKARVAFNILQRNISTHVDKVQDKRTLSIW